ncbi:MAG TPA: 1,2-phenylacetyl-CoA epoxidase subunit PaaC [Actinomycetota bacterium]|nr:1,2-phenylacetyl-CoA epoxidase subunit PaaC [Actinomycetota bacterium]
MMDDSLRALLLALGDDELIIGHRHSEWTGHAPHIEEDVAFSSIAQDEIGHAAAFFSLVADMEGSDPDAVALGRKPEDYRHAILCERPNGDWGYTLARHWLYDSADDVRLEALEESSHGELRAVAAKLRREERYHLLHAEMWMRRVSRGPVEARARVADALTDAFAEAVAVFEPLEFEEDAVRSGLLPVSTDALRARYVERTTRALDELGLPVDVTTGADRAAEFVASAAGDLIVDESRNFETRDPSSGAGGRRGRHSEEFGALWDEMTSTYRDNPGATW